MRKARMGVMHEDAGILIGKLQFISQLDCRLIGGTLLKPDINNTLLAAHRQQALGNSWWREKDSSWYFRQRFYGIITSLTIDNIGVGVNGIYLTSLSFQKGTSLPAKRFWIT